MPGANAIETLINDPLLYRTPLPYEARFYPLGFPADVASNSREVLDAARQSWGVYAPRFDTAPMRLHAIVSEGGAGTPPDPVLRGQRHLLSWVCDRENFSLCDRLQRFGYCFVTRATVADTVFFRWHFLEAIIFMLQEQICYTSLHAGCVALDGAGVLLYGDSGVGKSTLAYACARRGWTYISDDGSSVLLGGGRTVIGESHRFRFRAGAPDIFPELRGLTVGRELDRKPTIEVRTADLPIRTAPECRVDYIVFVHRRPGSRASLARISRADVRERLLGEMPLLDEEVDVRRTDAIVSISEASGYKLCYGSFEEAVPLLEQMVRAGGVA